MLRRVLALLIFLGLYTSGALGQAKRLLVIKVDGLPAGLVEHYLDQTSPATGKSRLPWIHHIFVEKGARIQNFYVRGISLSAPSWQMLETGHSLLIRGNAEYDRFTGHIYDYLNFFPFYVGYSRSKLVDMPAVEVLDQSGSPLLIDRFGWDQSYQSLELYQRGVRWKTLEGIVTGRFKSRSPRELFNEWQTGFELGRGVGEQVERDVTASLTNPNILYLDYFFGDFDHIAHLTNDPVSQYEVLQELDRLIGRLWAAAQNSPLGPDTLFVLVSDHGMNSDPQVYSQGFSLLRFFGSSEGGAHHVLTNRHPLTEYKLKGLDPFVSTVVTPSNDSLYLRDEAEQYPTAVLDLDGNERAAVYLRNSNLNRIQILLQQLNRTDLTPKYRQAAAKDLQSILDARRPRWSETARELREELAALRRLIDRRRAAVEGFPKKWSKADRESGEEQQARRMRRELDIWQEDDRSYSEYCFSLEKLVALQPGELKPGDARMRSLIPRRALGERNSIADLQHYVTGPSPRGLVLTPDGNLDIAESFQRIDYFARLASQRVRNNVQPQLGSKPVDFIAAQAPRNALADLPSADRPDEDGVWLYGDEQHQALILAKHDPGRGVLLRYLPVRALRQDEDGMVRFESADFSSGFPLHLIEDPAFSPPGGGSEWLSQWHTEDEWLRVTHRTEYSNAVIGLHAYFAAIEIGADGPLWRGAGPDTAVLRRFAERKRRLVQSDLLVLASNHWNFNVRGFNPGGNHGSFFRISTHSVWMMTGAGVPRGVTVETPCDSLSFVPTLLHLLGAPPGELQKFPGRPLDLNAHTAVGGE
jgi:hypothetical protein